MADDLLGPPVEHQQGLASIDYFITNGIKCPIMSQGRCREQAVVPEPGVFDQVVTLRRNRERKSRDRPLLLDNLELPQTDQHSADGQRGIEICPFWTDPRDRSGITQGEVP